MAELPVEGLNETTKAYPIAPQKYIHMKILWTIS